jgi:hypothetical protein
VGCEPDLQYLQPFDGARCREIDTQRLTDRELCAPVRVCGRSPHRHRNR